MQRNKSLIYVITILATSYLHANTIGEFSNKSEETSFWIFVLLLFAAIPVLTVIFIYLLLKTLKIILKLYLDWDNQESKVFNRSKKYLENPMNINDYCEKYKITKEEVNELINSGKLKAYGHNNFLFINEEK